MRSSSAASTTKTTAVAAPPPWLPSTAAPQRPRSALSPGMSTVVKTTPAARMRVTVTRVVGGGAHSTPSRTSSVKPADPLSTYRDSPSRFPPPPPSSSSHSPSPIALPPCAGADNRCRPAPAVVPMAALPSALLVRPPPVTFDSSRRSCSTRVCSSALLPAPLKPTNARTLPLLPLLPEVWPEAVAPLQPRPVEDVSLGFPQQLPIALV
mmetsp:Transcript_4652/g.11502  ORF Transcript_4652/g.11502 Transcript_4652/m.11502 type:complete len:209 (+) Transcript_4652:271-897(+)